ncbi:hypothetical protein CHARACLAT_019953 [Characodon lateralis]|uniref:Uncharacterized protein n=1 Tax=Characodon lateralis TaxID=208331 RepID=A0ABU7EVE1_9TELE|nr:hypothetical protein [Characodon lateralis]
MDPETETLGHITPQTGAQQSQGAWQAATGSELVHTKAPSPGHREPPTHRQAGTPATGSECGGEEIGPTFDREPELIQERKQSMTQPDTKNRHTVTITHSHPHAYT